MATKSAVDILESMFNDVNVYLYYFILNKSIIKNSIVLCIRRYFLLKGCPLKKKKTKILSKSIKIQQKLFQNV